MGNPVPGGRLFSNSAIDFMYWVLHHVGFNIPEVTTVDTSSTDVNLFNMSEIVQWAAQQVGVKLPIRADDQFVLFEENRRLISPTDALNIRGAVLYYAPSRIAISLGSGRTLEAVNGRVSIVRTGDPTRFISGALVLGIRY